MKYVIRAAIFQFMCIIIFAVIYWTFKEQFSSEHIGDFPKKGTIIDVLALSTTIQAGVGISDIYPNTQLTNFLVMFQQFIMICANIFLLYFFTL